MVAVVPISQHDDFGDSRETNLSSSLTSAIEGQFDLLLLF